MSENKAKSTEGLLTRLARLIDEITENYESLTIRQKRILREKGFERRHIVSLRKVQQAMIDANFNVTGNVYKNENQMELNL